MSAIIIANKAIPLILTTHNVTLRQGKINNSTSAVFIRSVIDQEFSHNVVKVAVDGES